MREKSFIRKNGYVLDVFSEGQELEKRNCQAARLDPAGSRMDLALLWFCWGL